ncbi:MAG: response regulator [Deltaproteobacteria bacterium]|nr:response regulator [Deltaproteobacteria bacterium]
MPSKKLLIADDSLTIQKVIKLALSQEEYEIQAVPEGNDAIQQIALFRPDVVLVDHSLPGKNAIEIKKTINDQSEFKNIRFVLMSSAFEKVDEKSIQDIGFNGRLTKPFDPTQLRQSLSQALNAKPNAKENTSPTLEIKLPLEDITKELHSTQELSPVLESLPPPLPPLNFEDEVDDIKKMTEETIVLSQKGEQNDFMWQIQEGNLKSAPSNNTHEFVKSFVKLEDELSQDPILPPLSGFAEPDDISFQLTPPPPPLPPRLVQDEPQVLPLTTGQMEELLKKQMQDTLEKMAQKLLPEVAEKILKQEIHKILEEQL